RDLTVDCNMDVFAGANPTSDPSTMIVEPMWCFGSHVLFERVKAIHGGGRITGGVHGDIFQFWVGSLGSGNSQSIGDCENVVIRPCVLRDLASTFPTDGVITAFCVGGGYQSTAEALDPTVGGWTRQSSVENCRVDGVSSADSTNGRAYRVFGTTMAG